MEEDPVQSPPTEFEDHHRGYLLQCEPNWNIGDHRGKEHDMRHYKLRRTNAIMFAGQISMSGDNMKIVEFCCAGFNGLELRNTS